MRINKKNQIKESTKILLSFAILLIFNQAYSQKNIYNEDLVEFNNVNYNNETYQLITMIRDDDKRVRAKYFACDKYESIKRRYEKFATNHNVICYTSGAYMDGSLNAKEAGIIGLNVDNGEIVNRSFPDQGGLDALVIVQATGGVVVSNLKENNLKLQGGNAISGHLYKIRQNSRDKDRFLDWAKIVGATVFQTHLLVWKNKIIISKSNSSTSSRERRFLAIGYDSFGNPVHCIINKPKYETLYNASKKVFEFLTLSEGMNVIALCNLDTGAQNVVKLFTPSGRENPVVKCGIKNGSSRYNLNDSRNLLVYYYH